MPVTVSISVFVSSLYLLLYFPTLLALVLRKKRPLLLLFIVQKVSNCEGPRAKAHFSLLCRHVLFAHIICARGLFKISPASPFLWQIPHLSSYVREKKSVTHFPHLASNFIPKIFLNSPRHNLSLEVFSAPHLRHCEMPSSNWKHE